MKTTLEFILPDERDELDLALKAGKLYSALHEVSNLLRKHYKYNDALDEKQLAFVTELRNEFHEIVGDLLD